MEEEAGRAFKCKRSGEVWRAPTEARADGNLGLFVKGLVATWLETRPLTEKARVGKQLKSQLAPVVRQADKEGASGTWKTQKKVGGRGQTIVACTLRDMRCGMLLVLLQV